MSHPEGIPSDIALLTGPFFWGNLFGYGLYGILIVQIFMYFHRFQRDPSWIKALVWAIFALETLMTVLGTIAGGNMLVSGWGNPATLARLDWALAGTPLVSGLVASCAHFFYCWRMHKLRQLVFIPITLAIISLLACSMAAYCGIHGHKIGIIRLREIKPYAFVWIGGSTFVDVSITICMVTILFQARSQTYFEKTTSLIQKLIALTIETAMATGFAGLSHAILYVTFPNNNLHFLTFLMLAKLYSNSLLATLNARALIGQQDTITAPALWADDSTGPSQHTSNNRRMFFMRPTRSSIPTTIHNSSETNHVGVETINFANGSELSLTKTRRISLPSWNESRLGQMTPHEMALPTVAM